MRTVPGCYGRSSGFPRRLWLAFSNATCWRDNILILLLDSKPIDMAKLRTTCEILLSHAMSVAHVALDADSQDIFYIGQKVIYNFTLKKIIVIILGA
jgi:hypothetical protein